jgi:hypothetical protein
MPILGTIASQISGKLSNPAYDSIATQTASGSSNVISFTGIPSTYKHLELRAVAKATRANGSSDGFWPRFNNTSADYYANIMFSFGANSISGYGGGPTSSSWQVGTGIATNVQANYFGFTIMRILDYTSNKWKSITLESITRTNNNTDYGEMVLGGGYWANTSALDRIDIYNEGNTNYQVGTVFALYGIKG